MLSSPLKTLAAAALLLTLPALAKPPIPAAAPLTCAAGTQSCIGAYGRQCYTPSAGQRCFAGLVCAAGTQACSGPYGSTCYTPAAGQRCLGGLVCGPGQDICMNGGPPTCYSPSAGQRCQ